MKEGYIAVFAKTPGLTPVKTRLSDSVGKENAEKIYKLSVACIEETLSGFQNYNPGWDIVWALAEEEGPGHGFWQSKPFQKFWTGNGGLGTRLYTVHSSLKQDYSSVLLVGTDSPQLTPDDFQMAVSHIKSEGGVIGPAHDGGYYLFGSNFLIEREIWESVPYSQNNTREEFLKKLNRKVPQMEMKSDIDMVDDIPGILQEMPDNPSMSQQQLIPVLQKF